MSKSKIVYLTAGAGGMFCGSCMHDNALAAALQNEGWEVQLVATYTPIRTDEADVSVDHVLYGGINVFLQQKIPLLRYLPAALDRFLDNPKLIRRFTTNVPTADPKKLGGLTVSMLKGTTGNQRKEVHQICQWLALTQPKILILSNILVGGCIPEIKKQIGVPILVTLQGDDVFLDSLLPKYKQQAIELIRRIADDVDGFIVHSQFYADYTADYYQIDRAKFHVTPLGLDVKPFWQFNEISHQNPSALDSKNAFTIGYLARFAPEKGLHHLIDGFIELKKRPGCQSAQLLIGGWQSAQWKNYTDQQWKKLAAAGLDQEFENIGSPDRAQKMSFFKRIDVMSVPTDFLEPKGLYALEAMAAGVPVVVPAHGAFPELIDSTGGGRLITPRSAQSWADAVEHFIKSPQQRIRLAQRGQQSVHYNRNAQSMAADTSNIIRQILNQ